MAAKVAILLKKLSKPNLKKQIVCFNSYACYFFGKEYWINILFLDIGNRKI
jgi:hypothetical protein